MERPRGIRGATLELDEQLRRIFTEPVAQVPFTPEDLRRQLSEEGDVDRSTGGAATRGKRP